MKPWHLYYPIFLYLVSLNCVIAQNKEQIINDRIEAFNSRDVEKYLEALDESVKEFRFPNQIRYAGLDEVRDAYLSAFKAPELSGTIEILGRSEIEDIYIIEQSLKGFGTEPVDQYVLYKFKGNKIIEIHHLPKNY